MNAERVNFGSRFTVIMALAGSAIGLGNLWRFPYMAGENGGAIFIIVYVAASILLSLPIFFSEFIIGRRSRANCFGAMKVLAPGSKWKWTGLLGVVTPLLILSYYSVVGGWSLDFFIKACSLSFTGTDATAVSGMFTSILSSQWEPLFFFVVYLAISCAIVAAGVKKGIEAFSKYSIPVLFVLVVVICIYSLTLPGAGRGVEYLVKPDFGNLSAKTFTNALGQSFYSMSLGMGIIITYASYVKKDENPLVSGLGTALADLFFAILAGFAIMPAVFAAGITPEAGAGLIFDTVPFIFSSMSSVSPVFSAVTSILFFLTVLVAALTSTISIIEVGVAYLVEERKVSRPVACLLIFGVALVLGCLCSLSLGDMSILKIGGMPLFDVFDKFCSNILLILGGLLCSIFVGWKMKKEDVRDEFTNYGSLKVNNAVFGTVYFLIRYVAPIAVALIFISNFF